MACAPLGATAGDPIRLATWHAELSRDGPGLLLRDILSGKDPQVEAAARAVVRVAPDILVLTSFDWDHEGRALSAFADRLAELGHPMPHAHAPRPNSGMASGRDLDGDGRLGTPDDALGWGRFPGQGGIALLSRHLLGPAEDFTDFLWADLPGALLATMDPQRADPGAAEVTRLSSTGHWSVTAVTPEGPLVLLAYCATPPVFDGPEDRNGRRNHDETAFWGVYLDGRLPDLPPEHPVVLLGNANLDPLDGEGRHEAIAALLAHPRLQDPVPRAPHGAAAALQQGGINASHRGDPASDTADWDDDGPGNLRVSYILPDVALKVRGAGILWNETLSGAGFRHGLVWVDAELQRTADRGVD